MKKKNLAILIWGIFGIVIIGFVITLIAINVSNNKSNQNSSGENNEVSAPTMVNQYGTFMITKDGLVKPNTNTDEKTGVYVYLDPICPGCGILDRELSPTFNKLLEEGKINLFITPLAFLDKASTDDYSSRVVSAAITIGEAEPEYFLPFINRTFETQPEEGPEYVSVSNEDLIKMAEEVGVSKEVAETIKDEKYKNWASENTMKVAKQSDVFTKGLGTPAVFINLRDANGKVINNEMLDFDTELPLDEYIIAEIEKN